MSSSYSPIDETSYTEPAGLDPAALYNDTTRTAPAPEETPEEEAPRAPAAPQPEAATAPHRTRKSPGAFSRFMAMLGDSRSAMFLGVILVVVAAYAFIVCLSYFMNIKNDQSAMLNADYDPTLIRNAGGPFGAWLAHTLIYDWLGMGSFILVYYVLVCGLSLLKVYRPGFWNLTLRCLLGAVSVSVIAGLVTYGISAPFYWGGLHGLVLNQKLITISGIWGAVGVSLILAGMLVILYLTEISRAIGSFRTRYAEYSERQAERRAERERERAERAARRAAEEAEAEAARMAAAEAEAAARAEAEAAAEAKRMAAAAAPVPAAPSIPVAADPVSVVEAVQPEAPEEMVHEAPEAEVEEEEELSLFSSPAPAPAVDATPEAEEADEPLFATPVRPAAIQGAAGPTAQPLYDPRADLSHYQFPSIDLLRAVERNHNSVDTEEMEGNKARITKTLNDYGIPISHIQATVGPTVTLYEIIPAEGVRIAKIKRLEDDIALSLAALGIRIIAPIPGKGTIGIEVPNKEPQTVSMRSIIESERYQTCKMELPMAMGCTISNEVFVADLCKMPHLLVAGATGMGKSVGLNAIIASLLYKKHPSELKFVLVDPKMVEFSLYAKLERHYLAKLPDEEDAIITDPSKVVATLNSLCVEMDNRYALLKDASMRTIKEYNERFCRHALNPAKGHRYLPYIVVIVDEFADLIMTAGKEVETPIARIAQKARAVGIHMILATQRPSTNVITGVIKANFPGRVAFRVFQMVDSRTIIDRPGANQLIGRGDMLFSNNGKIDRVQCAFIDTPEVMAICDFIDRQVGYDHAYELPEYIPESGDGASVASLGDRDPLFDECARLVVQTDTASTSSLQRRYSIGYNRAGKIMDQMEAAGIVGPSQGGKPRQVLVDPMTLERILENN